MNAISFVIIICAAIYGARGSWEHLNEQAWMDKQGREKYFEYSDLTAPAVAENSVDAFQPAVIKTRVRMHRLIVVQLITTFFIKTQPPRRHLKTQNPNVIDLFVDAIKNIVTPQKPPSPPKYKKNETNKGLDIKLETANNKFPPTFGNNQDLQLIYLGTKW